MHTPVFLYKSGFYIFHGHVLLMTLVRHIHICLLKLIKFWSEILQPKLLIINSGRS